MAPVQKLHLGCGPIYLKGYINIDAKGSLAKNDPELVKKNTTTLENYFKYPYKIKKFGHKDRQRIVVDYRQDISSLTLFKDNSVSEILTVNVINHMKFQDFYPKVIREWRRVLKPGGLLITDVDDIINNCKLVMEAKNKEEIKLALRYLYCHGRDAFDSHYWGYTEWYLKELLIPEGFEFVWRDDKYIYHDRDYPRFITCFRKKV